MAGKIQLKLGDLFNGTSDLIVLPCSTSGTITQFVFSRLKTYNIPLPKSNMELGDIDMLPFKGAENFAQYVAFAFSVKNNYSEVTAIERIGEKLGKLTTENPAIQIINAPLLGAGAGGLQSEKVIEALRTGFKKHSSSESTLVINILHESVFERVTSYFKGIKTIEKENKISKIEKHIRVFISYTKTDSNHQLWVENLARFLRENGINARIDLWHLKTGMDLPQFMTNELSLADKVIIVTNQQYAEKADGRFGGVGWETMIIQGDISNLPPESTKYITIVRENDLTKGLPVFLKTKYVIHWGNKQRESVNQQRLLNDLLNIDKTPPICAKPEYI